MTDVTCVAGVTVQEAPVHDDAPTHPGRHHHRQVRTVVARGAELALRQCQRSSVAVHVDLEVKRISK
jgi:hypothetical protein